MQKGAYLIEGKPQNLNFVSFKMLLAPFLSVLFVILQTLEIWNIKNGHYEKKMRYINELIA